MNDIPMSTGDPDVIEVVRQILHDHADTGGDCPRAVEDAVWAAMTNSDFHLVGLPETAGGVGGTLADVAAMAMTCAEFGIGAPIVENHVAQWARVEAGGQVSRDLTVLCQAVVEDNGERVIAGVPWPDRATGLLVDDALTDSEVREVPIEALTPGARSADLSGHDRQSYTLSAHDWLSLPSAGIDIDQAHRRTMLLRAAQMAGAIRGCFELTRRYTSERHQFGRSVDRFPAVQRHLVELAQADAITRVAVWRALAAYETAGDHASVYSAKAVCNEYARDAIRCAHQAHGAIGMTREYPLHRLTSHLHLWRLVDGASTSVEVALADRMGDVGDFIDLVWSETAVSAP